MKVYIFLLLFCLFAMITSCNKDEQNVNTNIQQEVLTTLTLQFTNLVDTSKKSSFTFRTNDGAAFGRNAKLDTVTLSKGTAYKMEVLVLDESKQNIVNQTDEINELSTEHQFFFSAKPSDLMSFIVSSFNKDSQGAILGTKVDSVFAGNNAGTGTLRVILRHQPNKAGLRVNQNDTTNAGGETDVAVTFPLVLK